MLFWGSLGAYFYQWRDIWHCSTFHFDRIDYNLQFFCARKLQPYSHACIVSNGWHILRASLNSSRVWTVILRWSIHLTHAQFVALSDVWTWRGWHVRYCEQYWLDTNSTYSRRTLQDRPNSRWPFHHSYLCHRRSCLLPWLALQHTCTEQFLHLCRHLCRDSLSRFLDHLLTLVLRRHETNAQKESRLLRALLLQRRLSLLPQRQVLDKATESVFWPSLA